MSRSRRFLLTAGAACVALSIPSARARAQAFGIHSRAVDFAPVDAEALGDTLRSSIGLFAGDEIGAAVGVGAWGGSLRVLGGMIEPISGSGMLVGMGYARSLATSDLAGPLHGTLGAELRGGFRHEHYASQDAGALRLTAPLGVSLGHPSGSSLGLYAAPYVESAVMRPWLVTQPGCTQFCSRTLGDVGLQSAMGFGVGFRAALQRFAVELSYSDVTWHRTQFYGQGQASLGLTYRLGQ
jgi:hypothetical protein